MEKFTIEGPMEGDCGWFVTAGGVTYWFATEQEAVGFRNIMMALAEWANTQETELRARQIDVFLRRYEIEPLDFDESCSQDSRTAGPKQRA